MNDKLELDPSYLCLEKSIIGTLRCFNLLKVGSSVYCLHRFRDRSDFYCSCLRIKKNFQISFFDSKEVSK